MTREFIDFVNAHKDEDTARLLLSAARYPSIDMPAAVQQIEGLRTAREKWPGLLECEEYLYPPRLNREQSSSEATARYKASIISTVNHKTSTVADLTGGMGIDTLAFAKVAEHVDYVERDSQLCALMEHNLRALGVSNVTVHCADSMEWFGSTKGYAPTTIYMDPARRDAAGRKVAGFEDCTPNILDHITNGTIQLIVNTPSSKKESAHDDSYLRKSAIKARVPYITTMAAAKAAAEGIKHVKKHGPSDVKSLQEWHKEIQ